MLQNESAVQLVPVLRPLVTANNFIAAYPNNNAIIITDYAENVRRIERIIRSIDLPTAGDVQVMRCRTPRRSTSRRSCSAWSPRRAPSPTAPGSAPQGGHRRGPAHQQPHPARRQPGPHDAHQGARREPRYPRRRRGQHLRRCRCATPRPRKIAETLRALLAGRRMAARARRRSPLGVHAAGMAAAQSRLPRPPRRHASAPVRLDDPAVPADQLAHHHRARAGVPQPARRDRHASTSAAPQVYVEALIVEISLGRAAEFGVQWQGLSNLERNGRTPSAARTSRPATQQAPTSWAPPASWEASRTSRSSARA